MIKQIFDFLYKANFNETTFGVFGNIKFILSKYFLILFIYFSIAVIFSVLGFLGSKTGISINHSEKIPTLSKIFLICLFAPIIEELIFRLPLVINKSNIIISLSCLTLFIYFFLKKYFINYEYLRYIFVFTFFIVSMYNFIFKYDTVYYFLVKNKLYFIHICSIFFCLAHLGNYNFNTRSIAPYLIIISLLINGYYFSYVRLRFGIEYSIFIHIFHNTLVSIPMIIKFIVK